MTGMIRPDAGLTRRTLLATGAAALATPMLVAPRLCAGRPS